MVQTENSELSNIHSLLCMYRDGKDSYLKETLYPFPIFPQIPLAFFLFSPWKLNEPRYHPWHGILFSQAHHFGCVSTDDEPSTWSSDSAQALCWTTETPRKVRHTLLLHGTHIPLGGSLRRGGRPCTRRISEELWKDRDWNRKRVCLEVFGKDTDGI